MTMFTVYGIYESGKTDALYIGCTMHPLRVRMNGHRASGVNLYLHGSYKPIPSPMMLKAYWMWRDACGDVSLDIRPISKHRNYRRALNAETRLIRTVRPALNTLKVPATQSNAA